MSTTIRQHKIPDTAMEFYSRMKQMLAEDLDTVDPPPECPQGKAVLITYYEKQ